ncbi:MAG TPA: ABC transporter ATP-binding protein [Pedobacter sp.]|nr:ABC transporter ATP-binding protein [Pedobacter sp.]
MNKEREPAIEVNGLSKSYIINHKNKASYSTIKDDFSKLFTHPFRKGAATDSEEIFWALDDISFKVNPGEIFGIIGRNGSGKSTLLKILSRIVEPTSGEAILRGRVASLLEVGTGFNPELTGRENIFFNGSMLGMSKREIAAKFDEIVEFSEVEKFIDTPVKFYSSGMYVRLAFSVAAYLEPDVLILDEVLAVGDAAFQKKSLNKILETMNDGRTVIFVSHSMSSIRQLCTSGIMLDGGKVVYSGPVDGLIEKYTLENDKQVSLGRGGKIGPDWQNPESIIDSSYFTPHKVYITDEKGVKITDPLPNNEDHWLVLEGTAKKEDSLLNIGYSVWDDEGRELLYFTLSTDGPQSQWPKIGKGKFTLKGKIPKHLLNAGYYKLKVIASAHGKEWIYDPDSSQIRLEISVRHGEHESPYWKDGRGGSFAPIF